MSDEAGNGGPVADEPAGGHPEPRLAGGVEAPPTTFGQTLRRLGPGIIIAGSIVGSGELIATTKVGAESGFWLLWLILIGCVIKVFAQVELGRNTVLNRETTLEGLNNLPGPRFGLSDGHFGASIWSPRRGGTGQQIILWYWVVMCALIVSQQGGIIGSVGQSLEMTLPLTRQGSTVNDLQDGVVRNTVEMAGLYREHQDLIEAGITPTRVSELHKTIQAAEVDIRGLDERIAAAEAAGRNDEADALRDEVETIAAKAREASLELATLGEARNRLLTDAGEADTIADFEAIDERFAADYRAAYEVGGSIDAVLWAFIVAIATSVILWFGRYQLIQTLSLVLVTSFTVVTVVTVLLLQLQPEWAVTGTEIGQGLSFRLPPIVDGLAANPVATALAAFGIIGVGAGELVMYPYWCMEKGYARFTGASDGSPGWFERARGWMRVMYFDAWASMIVYTFATVAFYLLGAATLGRSGLNPEGFNLVRTLAEMYVPVFGEWAHEVFLFGAIAVLYSTFFVVAAGYARLVADACGLFGLHDGSEATRQRWARVISVVWPVTAAALFAFIAAPAAMVLASGVSQALMLPMLAFAALYYRYKRCHADLRPSITWDVFLWISFAGLVFAGLWAAYSRLF